MYDGYIQGATEQKAIDEDAIHAIVEEQVLKAIEKQKAIDDKAKEEILNADSKRISRLLQRREYMVAKACNVFCHTGCPHKTDSFDCLNNKCDTWKTFKKAMEENTK